MNVLNTKTLILKHLGPQSIIVSLPLWPKRRDLSLQQPPSRPTQLPRDRVTNPTQTPTELWSFRLRQDVRSLIYFTLFSVISTSSLCLFRPLFLRTRSSSILIHSTPYPTNYNRYQKNKQMKPTVSSFVRRSVLLSLLSPYSFYLHNSRRLTCNR